MKNTLHFTFLRALMVLAFGLFFNVAWSQTSVQNFGTGTSSYTSTSGSATSVINPTIGTTYARAGAGSSSIAVLNNENPLASDGSYLKASASTSASVAKVSPIVGYTSSTEFYTSFKVIFAGNTPAAAAANGSWTFYQGAGSMYTGNSDFSGTQVFTGLRFNFSSGSNGIVNLEARQGGSWSSTGFTSSLPQKTVLNVEIIGNNKSSGNISYTYNGLNETVASEKYDVYVDGVLIGNDISSGQISSGTNITSTTFIGISSGSNAANIYMDDFVVYNSVPASLGNVITSTTWDGVNWSNGTPTTALDAVIAGNYNTSTNGAITAKSLTVNSGVFTIASGTSVTVENAVVNSAGVANFIVENNGNLIQNTTATNSGAITVKRNSNPLFRYDYTLWASPVVGQNVKAFSTATLSNRFLVYNTATGTNGDYETLFPTQSESTYNFEAGKGYLIRTSDTHPLYVSGNNGTVINAEFKGVPFNQNINIPLSSATTGFNLVGNPYASPISISQLFADNSNAIDGTVWFWRKRNGVAGTGYATSTGVGVTSQHAEATAIDPNGVIGAGQGFFVKVKSGATQNTLNLSNALRSTNTGGSFFRNYAADTERHRIWLNISNENGIVGQTLLGYMEGATEGIDYGIEGKYFNDSPIAFSSFVDNQEFAVQGRSLPFEATDVVPMSFKTDVAGNYTISVANFDGLFAQGQEIYVKDKFTGQVHDIKSSSYTFATETGVFNNRFEVVYQSLLSVGTPNVDNSAIVVYKQNGSLVVNAGQYEIATIEVYDMSGRLVFKKSNVNASDFSTGSLSVANQVLVVKVTTAENGTVNKKVVY